MYAFPRITIPEEAWEDARVSRLDSGGTPVIPSHSDILQRVTLCKPCLGMSIHAVLCIMANNYYC